MLIHLLYCASDEVYHVNVKSALQEHSVMVVIESSSDLQALTKLWWPRDALRCFFDLRLNEFIKESKELLVTP